MLKVRKYLVCVCILSIAALVVNVIFCEAKVQKIIYLADVDSLDINPEPEVFRTPQPEIVHDLERLRSLTEGEESSKTEQKELTPIKIPIETKPQKIKGGKPTQLFYQIAVNDKLKISVWRVPDLSIETTVGPDGNVSFPLVGEVYAAGRTLSDLDQEITERLKSYVVNPQVSVMVTEFAGDKLVVIGEVNEPGIYNFVGSTKLVNIIALVGGFTNKAKSSNLVVVREPEEEGKKPDVIVVDFKDIVKGNPNSNIEVMPNDIIYVPRTLVANAKEAYETWISPLMGTAITYETYKTIRRTRKQVAAE